MPALTVGGVTVPVAPSGFREDAPLEVGETLTAIDGTLLDSRTAQKRRWRVTTRLLSVAEHASVRAALMAATPVSVAGDLMPGTTPCAIRITSSPASRVGGGLRRALEFEVLEV